MRISFLSSRLPPAVCGVADHTAWLAAAMVEHGVTVSFVHRTGEVDAGALPSAVVDRWDGSGGHLVQIVRRQRPDWLWLQLSSYAYSRWGAPFRLARQLGRLKRSLPDVRLAICVHETHCQPRQLGRKGWFLAPWQRFTVGAVVRQADRALTGCQLYHQQIVGDYRVAPDRVVRLPIGPNLPSVRLDDAERHQLRRELGWRPEQAIAVTFGSYVSQLRALNACGRCLARGVAQGVLDRVVCLGGRPGALPGEFESWAAQLGGGGVLQVLGYLEAERCARLLACADFAFTGYPSERLAKSSGFAAYVQAGLPLLVAGAGHEEPELPPVLPEATWDWSTATGPEIRALRQRLVAYAETHLAWSAISRRAIDALRDG